MPDSFPRVPAANLDDCIPTELQRVDRAEITTRTIRHAARIYCAEVRRAGHCYPKRLLDHGWNTDFVLDHWNAIRLAGEDLVRAQRAAEAADDKARATAAAFGADAKAVYIRTGRR